MANIVRMAMELGYLRAPDGLMGRLDELKDMPHDKIVFVTTGSQGEPTSALVRIANRDHHQLHIVPGDTVAISATPVPGNEALVAKTMDNLLRQGANVVSNSMAPVHVHGHASQEELKLMLNVVKPKYFVPIHGEYRHLSLHAKLAESIGIPRTDIFLMDDGDVLEIGAQMAKVTGKVSSSNVYVDGLSVGDIGTVVLRDRKMLSRDGMVVVIIAINRQTGKLVGRPDIVSRGFVDTREAKEMLDESRDLVARILDRGGDHPAQWGFVNVKVRDTLNKFYYEQTKRRPMILPFMVKV
jgi:ribonuclease J